MNILVSVVAPCRNESAFIENFIENLLKQDFPSANIEYIIVDESRSEYSCGFKSWN
ncbi:MAG: glycosyltransferase [Candidatus Helarchaeota archaeon]